MSIETYGSGQRLRVAAALSTELEPQHLVMLPVPTTKDGKFITNTDIPLEDALCNVKTGSVIVGYSFPTWFSTKATKLKARMVDLCYDEQYLSDNARLTALATLGYILSSSQLEPQNMKIGIVGYGRIGSRLASMLLFMNCSVSVYSSTEATRIKLGECGIPSYNFNRLDSLREDAPDILINTAPISLSKYFPLKKAPSGVRLLELASGENFEGVEDVERLPALPEKYYPVSAGRTYFEAIKRAMNTLEVKPK